MFYFKDKMNGVHCLDSEAFTYLLPEGSTKITKDEADKITSDYLFAKEQSQDFKNAQALAYLASTDWYVIRFQETGTEIPQDILDARQSARDSVIRES